MEITFLGGAEEIGASCAVLDMDGARLVIDCGQRMNAPQGCGLPDLSFLESGPTVAAVLVTHAHADHIGALPALEPYLPADCPIYATEPTIAIAKVMLEDTLRIMNLHRSGDGELALFPAPAVRAAIARFRPVRWGKATRPAGSNLLATWFPAGHILGAAMIELRGEKESVLFSGDISVADQLSVPGVFVPAIRPTVLVLESTYGNRLHAHRPTQERRLVERVRAANAAGGSVLFPTFALGRAQEVLLILGRAMRAGSLPEIPVFADGLVRAVAKVYSRYTDDLAPLCRQLWEQGLDPIFPEDLPIHPIRNNQEREAVARGRPCVVVASSGMLQGGASQFYAKQWMSDERNLILVTGYQDEESPGQALLNLVAQAPGQVRYFKMGGVRTEVACQVESCQLSAHADTGELVTVATKLKPALILPVHGDAEAREGLAKGLLASSRADVVLPVNGDSYTFEGERSRSRRAAPTSRANPLSFWPPWDPQGPRELDLAKFHAWLVEQEPPISWITIEELAEIWKSPDTPSNEDWERLRMAVYGQAQPYFLPDSRRPYLLRLTPPENLRALPEAEHRIAVEQAADVLKSLFPQGSGLVRFGFYPEEGAARLEFRFPRATRQRMARRLGEFRERTGWRVDMPLGTREADLAAALRELSKANNDPPHALDHDQCEWILDSDLGLSAEGQADLAERFQRKTGYSLRFGSTAMPGSRQPADSESSDDPAAEVRA